MRSDKKLFLVFTLLLVITTILFVARGAELFIRNNKLYKLKTDYQAQLVKAQNNISADKEIWNKILSANSAVLTNENPEVAQTRGNAEELKNSASEDFREAIEWAEQKNQETSSNLFSPFDKSDFLDTYYKESNNTLEEVENMEKKISNIKLSEVAILFTLVMLSIGYKFLINNDKVNTGTTVLTMVLAIIALVASFVL